MKQGRNICNILREVRRNIARENSIPLEIPECTYEGECRGTCPRCESEVKYLEVELSRRTRMGIAATVAGVAVTLTSCDGEHHPLQPQGDVPYEDTLLHVDTTKADTASMPKCLADKLDLGKLEQPTKFALVGDCDVKSLDEDEYYEEGAIDDEPLVTIEEEPEFPGGHESLTQYLKDNIRYPEEAKANNIEGRVFVTFVVEEDGNISNIKLKRDIGGGCGQEAVRVIKTMPKWKPGKTSGTITRTTCALPIKFELPIINE